MGTDITLYAEVFRNQKWEPTPEPKITEWSEGKIVPIYPIDIGRPYELFAALAGVRQWNLRQTMHAVVKPIAEPRGLPEDLNDFYKEHFLKDAYDGCYFAHSWLMLREIVDYDWDGQFVTQKAYVKNQYANLFRNDAPFPEDFPEEGQYLYFLLPDWPQEKDTTEVSWITSYRNYVGCSESFIEELLGLGSPNEVRIIFWFDS
jgi:hypothetical protein